MGSGIGTPKIIVCMFCVLGSVVLARTLAGVGAAALSGPGNFSWTDLNLLIDHLLQIRAGINLRFRSPTGSDGKCTLG